MVQALSTGCKDVRPSVINFKLDVHLPNLFSIIRNKWSDLLVQHCVFTLLVYLEKKFCDCARRHILLWLLWHPHRDPLFRNPSKVD